MIGYQLHCNYVTTNYNYVTSAGVVIVACNVKRKYCDKRCCQLRHCSAQVMHADRYAGHLITQLSCTTPQTRTHTYEYIQALQRWRQFVIGLAVGWLVLAKAFLDFAAKVSRVTLIKWTCAWQSYKLLFFTFVPHFFFTLLEVITANYYNYDCKRF